MEKFFISLTMTMCIFCILTIPHLTKTFFGWGIDYTIVGIIISAIIANFINIFIVMPYLTKKLKL